MKSSMPTTRTSLTSRLISAQLLPLPPPIKKALRLEEAETPAPFTEMGFQGLREILSKSVRFKLSSSQAKRLEESTSPKTISQLRPSGSTSTKRTTRESTSLYKTRRFRLTFQIRKAGSPIFNSTNLTKGWPLEQMALLCTSTKAPLGRGLQSLVDQQFQALQLA